MRRPTEQCDDLIDPEADGDGVVAVRGARRLKRDHQTSSLEESNSSIKTPSPPIKKQKQQNFMDKETRNRYPNGSSSPFISASSTKKLVIKNLKSS